MTLKPRRDVEFGWRCQLNNEELSIEGLENVLSMARESIARSAKRKKLKAATPIYVYIGRSEIGPQLAFKQGFVKP